MNDVAIWAERNRKRLGLSQAEVGRLLGVSQPQARARLHGHIEFSMDEIRALERRFQDKSPIRGLHQADPEERNSANRSIQNLVIHAGMGGGGLLDVTLDRHGNVSDPAMVDGAWSFPAPVLSGFRHLPRTYAFQVIGDSMEPTIHGGAYVFVDTAHNIPTPPDVYACDYGDGLVVKRLELVPKSDLVRVISDNPRYSTYELQREDVRVYGRVVAFFEWRN